MGISQPFTLDTTFVPDYDFYRNFYPSSSSEIVTGNPVNIIVEENGKVVAYGAIKDTRAWVSDNVIRFNSDGSIDPDWNFSIQVEKGFYIGHKLLNRYFFGNRGGVIETDLSGNILTPGPWWNPDNWAPRDSGYSGGAYSPAYFFDDGSFIVSASGSGFPNSTNPVRWPEIIKVDSTGFVDTSFNHSLFYGLSDIVEYDSTRLLLYGPWVSSYDGIAVNSTFRIYKDGTIDTTFKLDPRFELAGRPILVQDDGKILVGARLMTLTNRSDTLALIRLHQDGEIDSTFEIIPSKKPLSNSLYTSFTFSCTTSDGGLLLGGYFDEYQGVPRHNIVKTDQDGVIDLRYFNGSGIDSTIGTWYPAMVGGIVPGQNDTYYVMGNFLMFDGQPVRSLIRLLGLSHTVGIGEEVEAEAKLVKAYPNPATDEVTFAWGQISGFGEVEVRLFDLQGRLLAEENWPPGIQEYTFSLPEYTGTIVYEVERSGLVERGKLVVRK